MPRKGAKSHEENVTEVREDSSLSEVPLMLAGKVLQQGCQIDRGLNLLLRKMAVPLIEAGLSRDWCSIGL